MQGNIKTVTNSVWLISVPVSVFEFSFVNSFFLTICVRLSIGVNGCWRAIAYLYCNFLMNTVIKIFGILFESNNSTLGQKNIASCILLWNHLQQIIRYPQTMSLYVSNFWRIHFVCILKMCLSFEISQPGLLSQLCNRDILLMNRRLSITTSLSMFCVSR